MDRGKTGSQYCYQSKQHWTTTKLIWIQPLKIRMVEQSTLSLLEKTSRKIKSILFVIERQRQAGQIAQWFGTSVAHCATASRVSLSSFEKAAKSQMAPEDGNSNSLLYTLYLERYLYSLSLKISILFIFKEIVLRIYLMTDNY